MYCVQSQFAVIVYSHSARRRTRSWEQAFGDILRAVTIRLTRFSRIQNFTKQQFQVQAVTTIEWYLRPGSFSLSLSLSLSVSLFVCVYMIPEQQPLRTDCRCRCHLFVVRRAGLQDKAVWNEQWMGWPVEEHYEAQSNYTIAHKLEGTSTPLKKSSCVTDLTVI